MNTPDKHESMSEQAAIFAELFEDLQNAFYDMPAPESESLEWGHVENAKKVNADLKEILEFLKP